MNLAIPGIDTSANLPAPAVTGNPLVLLRLEGAAVLFGALFAYDALGGGWGTFVLLFLLPDLSMIGYLAGPGVGAASYNAAHTYLAAAAVAAFGAVLGSSPALGVACIWAAHVGFDRMLGFGLKYPMAFGATHLGHRDLKWPALTR